MNFEWDTKKSALNLKKHQVSFLEAKSVFYDEQALLIADTIHSVDEDRFIILGLSDNNRELIVCHCYRTHTFNEDTIRIISARKADSVERKTYWKKRGNHEKEV